MRVAVVVLDRPNPLGGEMVEGPALRAGFESFVGPHSIATRHGLTMGELAGLYRTEFGLKVELNVIPCDGWRRDDDVRANRSALGDAVAEHADRGHGLRLSRPVPDRRDESLRGSRHDPAVRAVRRTGDRSTSACRAAGERGTSRRRLPPGVLPSDVPEVRRRGLRRRPASRDRPRRIPAGADGLAVLAVPARTGRHAVRMADGGVRVRHRPAGHRSALRQRPRTAGH